MKLQLRIIIIPILVVISAFLINMFVVEHHFEKALSNAITNYSKSILELRWYIFAITLFTILFISLLSSVMIQLMNDEIQKEKNVQEKLLIKKTREITLIQTMSTMLNSVNGVDDAAKVLHTIIPKLLPALSGAVFLIKDDTQEITELTHWGKDWSSDSSMIPAKYWKDQQLNRDKNSKVNQLHACSSKLCPYSEQSLCVNLVDQQGILGIMNFVTTQVVIGDELRLIVTNLAEQISFALSNLRLKDKLRSQAIRDPLTNLYNRRFMMEAFEPALHRAERHENHLAVLMIDLDHFKNFNDKFGHEVGDFVLKNIAEQFKSNLRLEDIACRYGGEEFIIICPDTNLRDAYVLAEKLINCINGLCLSCEEQNLGTITLSIGVAIYPNHAVSTQQLIIQADKALYAAKNRGRNCAVVAQANSRYYKNI
ncbi:MAG: sensor domain-containing diguanylate cyclase [Colwellia sp.]|nr:sensor domain-containing diguanylate cyclase [Colwellia sp.]